VSARFYCPKLSIPGPYHLDAEEARHLSQVCRVRVGDIVELFDGEGRFLSASVHEIGRNSVELEGIGEPKIEPEPLVDLTLAVAVPKGDRFDWLVEKATEIGTTRLVPTQTKRSVVEPRSTKLDRLRRTIIEASKQCGRSRLMALDELTPWLRIAQSEVDATRLIAHPGGVSFREWPEIAQGSKVVLAVGPEGGFTDEEVAEATGRGWVPVTLGRSILRIETACVVGGATIFARAAGLASNRDQAVH